MAFIGIYLGCLIESRIFNNNYQVEDLGQQAGSVWKLIRMAFFIFLSGLPMIPLLSGSFLVSKKSSFIVQLIFRYLLPPIASNIYLFGFSKYVVTLAPCFKVKVIKRARPAQQMEIESSGARQLKVITHRNKDKKRPPKLTK